MACGGLIPGCGGEDAAPDSLAGSSGAVVADSTPGASPFIAVVRLEGRNFDSLEAVRFRIEPRSGTASAPVTAHYAAAYLRRRGYLVADDALEVPVFGLYPDATNRVQLTLGYSDQSELLLTLDVASAPFNDAQGVIANPVRKVARRPGSRLGFDFFLMKTAFAGPVVVDTDGYVRWALAGPLNATSSAFTDMGFVVGAPNAPILRRIELDGAQSQVPLQSETWRGFHHNIDPGREGLLVEVNTVVDGVSNLMSTLAEIAPDGTILREWDVAAIFESWMLGQGDDPAAFVRRGRDWFHMNSATYDARDDSLIISSREHFLVKIDYDSGEPRWILGDPEKYWHTFPSLQSIAMDLVGGSYPLGQHSPSIASDGTLLAFDNGTPSFNQPLGAPQGDSRVHSGAVAYAIDDAGNFAQEAWRFDYAQSILSDVCSSAYEAADGSLLVTWSVADQGATARLVGLDELHEIVFDLEYSNWSPLYPVAWNAVPVPFEALSFE